MEFWIKAFYLLLSLSILIVLHEFGHYLPSRWFKTRVEKFYLFFDYKFSLFKKKIGETEWGIGWIPLGGYVKIAGMIDESMDKEQMAKPPQPWEFRSKPAWQRLIIMLGGVTVNLILGVFIYAMVLFSYGERVLPMASITDGIWVQNDFGEELGFKTGDKIVSVNGQEYDYWGDMRSAFFMTKGATIGIERSGENLSVELPGDLTGQMSSGSSQGAFFGFRFPFVIAEVGENSHNAGVFEKGDKVVSINGQQANYFDQASEILSQNKGQTIQTEVMRNGEKVSLRASVNADGLLGVLRAGMGYKELDEFNVYNIERRSYSFLESFPAGWNRAVKELSKYVEGMALALDPSTGAHKGLGGFGAIGGIMPGQWGQWEHFWTITAWISIVLAFMNLLPIPLLDGGHVMFLLYEMVSGRKPNERLQEIAQTIGLVLLLALLLYANGNDLARAMGWR